MFYTLNVLGFSTMVPESFSLLCQYMVMLKNHTVHKVKENANILYYNFIRPAGGF
uniref:Uncharacterized protein n=1 Tax=viral metagenome TaxID=1070528 RepID=A0A6C0CJZ4_9ZZZZ